MISGGSMEQIFSWFAEPLGFSLLLWFTAFFLFGTNSFEDKEWKRTWIMYSVIWFALTYVIGVLINISDDEYSLPYQGIQVFFASMIAVLAPYFAKKAKERYPKESAIYKTVTITEKVCFWVGIAFVGTMVVAFFSTNLSLKGILLSLSISLVFGLLLFFLMKKHINQTQ